MWRATKVGRVSIYITSVSLMCASSIAAGAQFGDSKIVVMPLVLYCQDETLTVLPFDVSATSRVLATGSVSIPLDAQVTTYVKITDVCHGSPLWSQTGIGVMEPVNDRRNGASA